MPELYEYLKPEAAAQMEKDLSEDQGVHRYRRNVMNHWLGRCRRCGRQCSCCRRHQPPRAIASEMASKGLTTRS
jgi:hypothetical protein